MARRALVALGILAVVIAAVAATTAPARADLPPCCLLAYEIGFAIQGLTEQTMIFLEGAGGPPARGAQLLKDLAKAQEFLSDGFDEDESCTSRKAKQKFQYARGWLVNYREIALLYGEAAASLIASADAIIAALDLLVAGTCEQQPT